MPLILAKPFHSFLLVLSIIGLHLLFLLLDNFEADNTRLCEVQQENQSTFWQQLFPVFYFSGAFSSVTSVLVTIGTSSTATGTDISPSEYLKAISCL